MTLIMSAVSIPPEAAPVLKLTLAALLTAERVQVAGALTRAVFVPAGVVAPASLTFMAPPYGISFEGSRR